MTSQERTIIKRQQSSDPSSLPAPTLGVLADIIGFHLARASVVTDASFRERIGTPFALRKVEFSLLMLLLANGPMAPKSIGRLLTLSAPNLTLQLDRLDERSLARRERNPHDGRSQYIVLTEQGQRFARKAARAAASLELSLNERLGESERDMLIVLLGKLAGRPRIQARTRT